MLNSLGRLFACNKSKIDLWLKKTFADRVMAWTWQGKIDEYESVIDRNGSRKLRERDEIATQPIPRHEVSCGLYGGWFSVKVRTWIVPYQKWAVPQATDKKAVFYTARPLPILFSLVLSLFSWHNPFSVSRHDRTVIKHDYVSIAHVP